MDAPAAADIRAWGPPDFPWSQLGWAAPGSGTDPLEKRVEWSIGYVENTTWRPLSTIAPPGEAGNLPMVETGAQLNLIPVAEQAVALAVLQMLARQSKKYFTATVLQGYIQAFTAGSYSETRGGAENVIRSRGGSVENPLVNEWRPLSDLLYLLMTPDSYGYWRYRLTGINPPAGGYIGQDFGMERSMPPAAWGPGIESWPVGGRY